MWDVGDKMRKAQQSEKKIELKLFAWQSRMTNNVHIRVRAEKMSV